jgi:hypothetical protein
MGKESGSSGGIGFLGLLCIAFIVLKLTHFIDWSWWWVLAPVWVVPVILIVIIIMGLLGEVILAFLGKIPTYFDKH